MKNFITLLVLVSFGLVGCPEIDWAKLSSELETQEVKQKCEWKPIAESMFPIRPLNEWFKHVPPPMLYKETHWAIEAYGLQNGDVDYDELRKFVLEQYVKLKILPEGVGSGNTPFPSMFYKEAVWEKEIKSMILKKYGSKVQFCKARVTIRSKRRSATPDLKWWDEITINLNKEFGECQPCEE